MTKNCIFILIVVFLASLVPNMSRAGETINWQTYDAGLSLGKKQKKKIFLHFYASWCGACKMMAQTTMKDAKVVAYLNENYIPIMVNVDKERRIVYKYNVSPIPDSRFLDEKGVPIGMQPGYVPSDELLKILKYVHTDSYKKMSFDAFVKKKTK